MRKSACPLKSVAVLGSGTAQPDSSLYQQAVQLGHQLAKNGFTVYHGGYGGVMEAVAQGVKKAGGRNIGITIKKTLSKANPWADAEVQMPSWEKRLLKLIEVGDAYIFFDGATGTLNELFFVWEMANKKLHAKPIVILGKQLRKLVTFLKKDSSLKIPPCFHLVSSIPQTIKLLQK